LGASKAIEFLKDAPDPNTFIESEIRARLTANGLRIVDKQDLAQLARAEEREGPLTTPNSFHFIEEEAIFKAIDAERNRAAHAESTPEVAAD
jgi:hypothetical protein